MKYLCLVYLDEKRLNELPDEDCVAYDAAIRDSGHCLASEALQSVHTATSVRVRDGKVSVTDGPFAETKEQLGGYYLIECDNLDQAMLEVVTGAREMEVRNPALFFFEPAELAATAAPMLRGLLAHGAAEEFG